MEPPHLFEVNDGFADAEGNPVDTMPSTTMRVTFEATDSGSRLVVLSTFASVEALEQLLAMGMLEGLTAAMGQLDDVLASVQGDATN